MSTIYGRDSGEDVKLEDIVVENNTFKIQTQDLVVSDSLIKLNDASINDTGTKGVYIQSGTSLYNGLLKKANSNDFYLSNATSEFTTATDPSAISKSNLFVNNLTVSGSISGGGGYLTESSVNTLTNKSMSGLTNTFTNMPVQSVASVGSGYSLYSDNLSGAVKIKSLQANTNKVSLSSTTNEVKIDVDETKLTIANQIGYGSLITDSSTNTFTNKTINGDSNTIRDYSMTLDYSESETAADECKFMNIINGKMFILVYNTVSLLIKLYVRGLTQSYLNISSTDLYVSGTYDDVAFMDMNSKYMLLYLTSGVNRYFSVWDIEQTPPVEVIAPYTLTSSSDTSIGRIFEDCLVVGNASTIRVFDTRLGFNTNTLITYTRNVLGSGGVLSEDGYLYTTSGSLRIYDLRNPLSNIPSAVSGGTVNGLSRQSIVGKYMCIRASTTSLEIYSLVNPLAPALIVSVTVATGVGSYILTQNHLIVFSNTASRHDYSIYEWNSTSITLLKTYVINVNDGSGGMALYGNRLFCALTSSDLVIEVVRLGTSFGINNSTGYIGHFDSHIIDTHQIHANKMETDTMTIHDEFKVNSGIIGTTNTNSLRIQTSTAPYRYAEIKAPAIGTNYTLTLPAAVGSTGQTLITSDGAGTYSWGTPITTVSSAGGTSLINTGTGTTASLKGLTATSNKITLVSNANDIGIDVDETKLTLANQIGYSSLAVNGGNSGTDLKLGLTGANSLYLKTNGNDAIQLDVSGHLNILGNRELRLQDATGGEYVGFKAAGSTTSYSLTLPAVFGANSQILKTTDGIGTLGWATVGNTIGLNLGTTGGTVLEGSHSTLTVGCHGVNAGAIVGTESNQTLLNKKLVAPVIHDDLAGTDLTLVHLLTTNKSAFIPDLTANDTFVFQSQAQTLSNKTLTAPLTNTIKSATATDMKISNFQDINAITIKNSTGFVEIKNHLTVGGDLIVNGDTTTITTTNITVEDPLININTGAISDTSNIGLVGFNATGWGGIIRSYHDADRCWNFLNDRETEPLLTTDVSVFTTGIGGIRVSKIKNEKNYILDLDRNAYGVLYRDNGISSPYVITAPISSAAAVILTGGTALNSLNTTISTNYIALDVLGVYEVSYTISCKSNAVDLYMFAIFKTGVNASWNASRVASTSSYGGGEIDRYITVSKTTILSLLSTDYIQLGVACAAAGKDISIASYNLSIVRLNGTT